MLRPFAPNKAPDFVALEAPDADVIDVLVVELFAGQAEVNERFGVEFDPLSIVIYLWG